MPVAKLIAPTTKQEIPKLRVAAYCRVSSNSADQRNSFATQERVYTKYIAEKQEWELVDIFADEGLSGMKADNRPEFQRMIRMCELHQIDLILTKSVSRFARNVKEALNYTRKLKLLGIGVQFEEDGINTLAMADEMLLNTFAAIAQEESESISQNERLSIVKRMERGEYIATNVPYGYRLIDKKLVVYEPEAKIVRWIFDAYLNGMSATEIARELTAQGIPTKDNKANWKSNRLTYKHLIQGNHDRVKGKLRPYWESIEQYAEVNDENRLVILSHYPILFYKNQHYGAVMLYGHVHNTREWELVEKWKKEQWAMGIPSRLINVGCMMAYMNYTPRTLDELLDVNPMPEIARVRKDGSAVENAEQRNKQEGVWDLNEGYTAEKTE